MTEVDTSVPERSTRCRDNAHLLRRTGELIGDSVAGQAKIPHVVRRLLLDALAVRDAHPDLLTPARDDVIDATAVEITQPQPLLNAGDDRDDRDEIIAAGPGLDARKSREPRGRAFKKR